MGRLEGKVALVTGAAQGIGREIARLFALEGAKVILSDVQDKEGKKSAEEIGGCLYVHQDVSEETEWIETINLIEKKFGQLNILVNNAGITGTQEGFGPQNPEYASLRDWRKIQAVNSDSVFLGCKYGIGLMKKTPGGSIVNISSRSGMVGIPNLAPYAASKAAVHNLTKSVALYCCEKSYLIRCNSVHPAAILTPIWEPMLGSDKQREQRKAAIEQGIPMHKMGSVEDVAYAVVFLASDEAKYITGTELIIDGGILAGASASPKKAE